MRQFIERELRRAERRISGTKVSAVVATSGTAAALSDACRAMAKGGNVAKRTMAGAADGVSTPTAVVRHLATRLTRMTDQQRALVAGIGPRRSEIIVAGAHVYAELLERFGLSGFRYSPIGLRDGILEQMLAERDSRTLAHQQFERERWESVISTCQCYGVDPKQAEPVRQHAGQLFRDLERLHQLPAEYRVWLETAAMLRDVGKFLNYQGHHRHAQYIVAHSEIFGFSVAQRAIISAITRYLGKSRPTPADRAMRPIHIEEHESVRRAVVLLRLAMALNQDRASDVLKVAVRVYPKRVLLELRPGRTGAELELWSLRKEADYFFEVFRRELFVTLA
jgi:exopolyphosphatase / guanosine-5'-triphosphate,3'-diphosphate pyrophosphatase